MAIEDKVVEAIPFAKRVFEIEKIVYGSISENGFFLTFAGNKILEFNTAQAASDNALALNQAIAPTILSLRAAVRQQIGTILS